MRLRRLFILISFAVTLFNGFDLRAQVEITLNVATAGTLTTLINPSQKNLITNLTLTGILNGNDIRYIREMAGNDIYGSYTSGMLSELDLSGANIVSGGSFYFISSEYCTTNNMISDNMFYGCRKLKYVKLPYSVTSIGDWVFQYCTELTSVTIGNSVTTIGHSVFASCPGLKSIIIPNNVTSIGSGTFNYCTGLTSITIGNSVTSIGSYAFGNCLGLTSITIPNSVTSLSDHAFVSCTGLTSITIPNRVTSIGQYAFTDCSGLTSVNIESGAIGYYAFYNCVSLKFVTIGNSVTSIDNNAFYNCGSLTSLTFGNSITSIGDDVFWGCTGLTTITLPCSVTSIGQNVFRYCSGLTSVTIESGAIGHYAFYNCGSLTSLTLGNSVTSIGNYAFSGCIRLNSINIPNGVTSIGQYAFSDCIGSTSLTIPNSVTTIGQYAFSGCRGLTTLTIPNSVTTIGQCAFSGCRGLTTLTLPNSVTSIGSSAFYGCTGLTEIYCKRTTPPTVSSNVFTDVDKATCKLYVPVGCSDLYKAAAGWRDFTNIIDIVPTYSIKSSSNSGGTIEVSGLYVKEGEPVTFIFVPNQGYEVVSATFNGKDITSEIINYTYTLLSVTQNIDFSVIFKLIAMATTVTAGEGGKAVLSSPSVEYGNSVTLTITPNEGYVVDKATKNGTDITDSIANNSYTATVIKTAPAFNVTFKKIELATTTSVGEGGKAVLSSQSVEYGTSVTLTITPNEGYVVDKATMNGTDITDSIVNNAYTATVIKTAPAFNVTFKKIVLATIATAGEGGKAVLSSQSVEYGTSVTLTITPNEGYVVDKATMNGTDITDSIANNSYTATVFKTAPAFNVTFKKIVLATTATAGEGGKAVLSSQSVEYGTSVTLTITPNEGYVVDKATMNGTDITDSIVNNGYTATAIKTASAFNVTFKKIELATTVTAGEGGKATLSNQSVEYGNSVTLTITPDEGYELDKATMNGTDITDSIVNNGYTATEIKTASAFNVTFKKIELATTVTAGEGGKATLSSQSVEYGNSVTLTITPDEGYVLNIVTMNGNDITDSIANNAYTTEAIKINIEFMVIFKLSTDISQAQIQKIKAYKNKTEIILSGLEAGNKISVYTCSGILLQIVKATDNMVRMNLPSNQIYIINTAGITFKVAL